MKILLLIAAAIAAGCSSTPPPPDWRTNSHGALQAFERGYLAGDSRLADAEFARGRAELARTGRADLVARAELLRCALRVASLEFDACPGFEALRRDTGANEAAYADYLAGRGPRPGAAPADDPLSRLVAAGVQMRSASLPPQGVAAAVDIASAQGWRRPLLAWLRVQLERAEKAGEGDAADRIRRRIELVIRPAGG